MANSFDISVNSTHAFHCNNLWCPAIRAPIWHCWSRAKFPIVVTEDLNALTVGSCDDDSGADSWLILVWICACRCLHSSCDLWRYLSLTSGANTFQLRLIKAILSRLVNAALLCWGYWSCKYNAYAVRDFEASTAANFCNWTFSALLTPGGGMARKQVVSV